MDTYSSLFVFFFVFGQYFSFTEQACYPNQTELGGSCYYFSLDDSDFDTSRASCASLGMHLVFIGSQDEQEFLVDTRPDKEKGYWIGLSKATWLGNVPTTTWLDGSSLNYRNFADSAFDEGGECFRMSGSGSQYKWKDKDCYFTEFHYICETENVHPVPLRADVVRQKASLFKQIQGWRLRNHVIKTKHGLSLVKCGAECNERDDCVSFNIGNGVCELNNQVVGGTGVSRDDFVKDEGLKYYEKQ